MATPAPRIVVIDDDMSTTDMLRDLLTDEGYQVRCCSNDDQTITIIRDARPDLVIVDLWLAYPWSGWTIVQAMRQDPLLRTIPVIVYTADRQYRSGQAEELRALGCKVVYKPFEIEAFCAKIKMMLCTTSIG